MKYQNCIWNKCIAINTKNIFPVICEIHTETSKQQYTIDIVFSKQRLFITNSHISYRMTSFYFTTTWLLFVNSKTYFIDVFIVMLSPVRPQTAFLSWVFKCYNSSASCLLKSRCSDLWDGQKHSGNYSFWKETSQSANLIRFHFWLKVNLICRKLKLEIRLNSQ